MKTKKKKSEKRDFYLWPKANSATIHIPCTLPYTVLSCNFIETRNSGGQLCLSQLEKLKMDTGDQLIPATDTIRWPKLGASIQS